MISGESINLGILFSYEHEENRCFISTKNYKRVTNFDDEIDIDIVKFLLDTISKDVEVSIETLNRPFSIENYTQYYCNEFNFSNVVEVSYEDAAQKMEEIKKVYLRYDLPQSKRATKADEIKLLSQIIKTKTSNTHNNIKIKGKFDDRISIDIAFDDYYIRIFFITNTNKKQNVNAAKVWAFNCENNEELRKHAITVCQYEDDLVVDEDVEVIIRILNSLKSYMFSSIDDGIECISHLIK